MKPKKILLAFVAICAMGLTSCGGSADSAVDNLIDKLGDYEKVDNPLSPEGLECLKSMCEDVETIVEYNENNELTEAQDKKIGIAVEQLEAIDGDHSEYVEDLFDCYTSEYYKNYDWNQLIEDFEEATNKIFEAIDGEVEISDEEFGKIIVNCNEIYEKLDNYSFKYLTDVQIDQYENINKNLEKLYNTNKNFEKLVDDLSW